MVICVKSMLCKGRGNNVSILGGGGGEGEHDGNAYDRPPSQFNVGTVHDVVLSIQDAVDHSGLGPYAPTPQSPERPSPTRQGGSGLSGFTPTAY